MKPTQKLKDLLGTEFQIEMPRTQKLRRDIVEYFRGLGYTSGLGHSANVKYMIDTYVQVANKDVLTHSKAPYFEHLLGEIFKWDELFDFENPLTLKEKESITVTNPDELKEIFYTQTQPDPTPKPTVNMFPDSQYGIGLTQDQQRELSDYWGKYD